MYNGIVGGIVLSLEKKIYKFIIALFVFNCFLTNVFSQSIFNLYNQQEEIPNLSDQRQIIIIDSLMDYDLNPHTANYSNEAQILLGVYEGFM